MGNKLSQQIYIRQEESDDFYKIEKLANLDPTQWKNLKINKNEIIKFIRSDLFYVSDLSLVAYIGKELAGHLMFTRLLIQGEFTPSNSLLLGPLSIDPKFQKKGVGKKLVSYGLNLAREKGYKSVFVIGHDQFYLGLGFVYKDAIELKENNERTLVFELQKDEICKIIGKLEPFGLLNSNNVNLIKLMKEE